MHKSRSECLKSSPLADELDTYQSANRNCDTITALTQTFQHVGSYPETLLEAYW